MYNSMLWFLLIGAVLPVIIYFLSVKFPNNKFLQKVCQESHLHLRFSNSLTVQQDSHARDFLIYLIHSACYSCEHHLLGPGGARLQLDNQATVPRLVDKVQLPSLSCSGFRPRHHYLPRLLLPDLSRC